MNRTRLWLCLSAAALSGGLLLFTPGTAPADPAPRPKATAPNRNVIRPSTSPSTTTATVSPVPDPNQQVSPVPTVPSYHHRRHRQPIYPPASYSPYPSYAYPYPMPYRYPSYSATMSRGSSSSPSTSSRDLNYTPADAGMLRIAAPNVYARVTVNGRPISPIGDIRYYVTPTLQSGESYPYKVRAVWKRDGRTISIDKTVYAKRGQTTEVDLVSPNLK